MAVEPAPVSDAALHGTEEDFQALEASIERLAKIGNDAIAFANENREFHSIIARASANPVLETFWSTISILASGEHHGLSYTANNRAHIVKAHRRILDACRRRQPDEEIGRAHVRTPVTNAHLVCRLLHEQKKEQLQKSK